MSEKTKVKAIADKPVYEEYLNNQAVGWSETHSQFVGDKEINIMDKINPLPGLTNPVKYIEKEYPETAESFKEIQKEQYELFCKKQMDYGPKNISVGTDLRTDEDVKLSLTGLWFRINDKIERLKQLVVFDKAAQNEPMIDAFSDLSVYGIIAQIVHRKKWGK